MIANRFNNFKKNMWLRTLMSLSLASSCISLFPPMAIGKPINRNNEDYILQTILERFKGDQGANEYKVFKYPNLPPNNIKILPDWNKTSYLVLAFPINLVYSDKKTEVYASLIKKVLPDTKILFIVQDEGNEQISSINKLVSFLNENELTSYIDNGTIDFLPTRLDSIWVRDYGPFFGIDSSGKYYIIDTIYDDFRYKNNRDYRENRDNDDLIPFYVLNYLNAKGKKLVSIRPPMILNGGDFYTDGKNLCFTSTNTLLLNGGNEDEVNLLFKRYFGCQKVSYLKPLPGPTVKHIDMFFKIVDESTVLLGQYNEVQDKSSPTWLLQKEAREILNENQKTIQKVFDSVGRKVKIISIEMPDILSKEKEKSSKNQDNIDEKFSELYDLLKNKYADNSRDNPQILENKKKFLQLTQYRSILNLERSDSEKKRIRKRLYEKLIYLATENEDLKKDYSDEDWEKFKQKLEYFKSQLTANTYNYIYPTYLNSTVVTSDKGNLVIVPSYKNFEFLEKQIENVYTEAYKNAKVMFVNSDLIIPDHGAIHCITNTIPVIEEKQRAKDRQDKRSSIPSPDELNLLGN